MRIVIAVKRYGCIPPNISRRVHSLMQPLAPVIMGVFQVIISVVSITAYIRTVIAVQCQRCKPTNISWQVNGLIMPLGPVIIGIFQVSVVFSIGSVEITYMRVVIGVQLDR